ncbi:hypothetical protein ACFQ60_02560 [Streptomyces zhihengii]
MLDVAGVGVAERDEDAYLDMADAFWEFADDAGAAHGHIQQNQDRRTILMTSPEVRQLLESARALLPQETEWDVMNSVPTGYAGPVDATVPDAYREYLGLADGGIFSTMALFDADHAAGNQFLADPVDGAPVTLGGQDWFCLGKIYEDPVFLKRADGTVWGFPDQGINWWQSDVFEKWADDLDAFLRNTVFGPGFRTVTGADDEDPWWQVLREMGRVSR